ncbi:RBR family RING finger protein [Parendozoicomonas haliclonae]|uniref:RBR family RING finger protein n=1 Tax=Parendozoicomonas haliclonae TaxID=1960125 RepID=UPI0013FD3472|nr:IBR domain-containing protein [Parendozoicomonas haliclonae]
MTTTRSNNSSEGRGGPTRHVRQHLTTSVQPYQRPQPGTSTATVPLPPPEDHEPILSQSELWEQQLIMQQLHQEQQKRIQLEKMTLNEEESLMTCDICVAEVTRDLTSVIPACKHTFCNECVKGHINSSATWPYTCASSWCNKRIPDLVLGHAIGPRAVDQQKTRVLEKTLESGATGIGSICKNTSCLSFDVYPRDSNSQLFCKVCEQSFCKDCTTWPFHKGISCMKALEERVRKGDQAAQSELDTLKQIELDQHDHRVARCPGVLKDSQGKPLVPSQTCNAPIEKPEGCNHMNCTVCKHQFCFLCKRDWVVGKPCNPNSHDNFYKCTFCPLCNRKSNVIVDKKSDKATCRDHNPFHEFCTTCHNPWTEGHNTLSNPNHCRFLRVTL